MFCPVVLVDELRLPASRTGDYKLRLTPSLCSYEMDCFAFYIF